MNICDAIFDYEQNVDTLSFLRNPKENFAFLDSEFQEKDDTVLSVGLVICNKDYEIIDNYYSIVHSDIAVNELVQSITGITTEQIKNTPDDFKAVSRKISDIVKKYKIKRIFVWGDVDQAIFKRNSQKIMSIFTYVDLFIDISSCISEDIVSNNTAVSISMNNLCAMCNVKNNNTHNAYSDAKSLYDCIYNWRNGNVSEANQKKIRNYYHGMSEYYKYRYSTCITKKLKPTDIIVDSSRYLEDAIYRAYIDNGISLGLIAENKNKIIYQMYDENNKKYPALILE